MWHPRRWLHLLPALALTTACQATGMGWIPSAYDPNQKATFGFVYDGDTMTFSGSYHDHAGEVDFKGTGVLKSGPPPAGIHSKGGCLLGFPAYESQNANHPGQGNLFLFVCDMDGDGAVTMKVRTKGVVTDPAYREAGSATSATKRGRPLDCQPLSVVDCPSLAVGLGCRRGATNEKEREPSHPLRGGVEPQALNWSLEPAASQSETGPTHHTGGSLQPVRRAVVELVRAASAPAPRASVPVAISSNSR